MKLTCFLTHFHFKLLYNREHNYNQTYIEIALNLIDCDFYVYLLLLFTCFFACFCVN
jgi:hypothetical protein